MAKMPVKKEMAMDFEKFVKYNKHKGMRMLILGLLVLANAYWSIVGWEWFAGIILVLAGLYKFLMPMR